MVETTATEALDSGRVAGLISLVVSGVAAVAVGAWSAGIGRGSGWGVVYFILVSTCLVAAVMGDASVLHREDTVGEIENPVVMGDDDDGAIFGQCDFA